MFAGMYYDTATEARRQVADYVVKLRALSGMSGAEFCDFVGVSRGAVYKWEHGRMMPFGENREWICRAAYDGRIARGIATSADMRSAQDLLDALYAAAIMQDRERRKQRKDYGM